MNLALFYDTETTDLLIDSLPPYHPNQPHIVQLAACLVDLDTRNTVMSMDLIVKPDGWTIPDETIAIHGITNEFAHAVGFSESYVLGLFMRMHKLCKVRIAHNEPFDAAIIFTALLRDDHRAPKKVMNKTAAECTGALAKPIMQLPPSEKMIAAGETGFKRPSLIEAYKYFTGKDHVGAHNAMADVEACKAIYFEIKDHG